MSKVIRIGTVSIPLDQYVVGGTAVLGIRGTGKTYLAKGIAEQLLDAGIPIVVFDAIGVWRYLKVAGQGDKARGFKIVVAGGKKGDLPLTPESAPEIVRAAIRENIPLIVDLYDKRLSKGDWRRIVQRCMRVLLYENTGLRHVFLEEAAEYIPQKVNDGETYAEVEKLVRMGGNASIGVTLINQRAQEVNKAVLDLCENLVLMRQRGAHAIDSLEKWMDRLAPADAKRIAATMPGMGVGDAWVFTSDSEAPMGTKSAALRSYHPDRRNPDIRAAAAAPADTADFVTKLTCELQHLAKEATDNDPKVLRARIHELEHELRKPREQAAAADELEQAEQRGFDRGCTAGVEAQHALIATLRHEFESAESAFSATFLTALNGARPENPVRRVVQPAGRAARSPEPPSTVARARQIDGRAPPTSDLSGAARKILTVLAQHREGCTAGKLALLTGYSYSGGFRNSLSELRTAGYLEGSNTDVMRITTEGVAQGPFEPLPTGRELQRYWLTHQSLGGGARKVLEQLIAHPRGMTAEHLAAATGYEYSGGFRNALSELRTAGVLVGKNTGVMTLSEELR